MLPGQRCPMELSVTEQMFYNLNRHTGLVTPILDSTVLDALCHPYSPGCDPEKAIRKLPGRTWTEYLWGHLSQSDWLTPEWGLI